MKTIVYIKKPSTPTPDLDIAVGNFYTKVESSDIYLLVDLNDEYYTLANLSTGQTYSELHSNIKDVFYGFDSLFTKVDKVNITV